MKIRIINSGILVIMACFMHVFYMNMGDPCPKFVIIGMILGSIAGILYITKLSIRDRMEGK